MMEEGIWSLCLEFPVKIGVIDRSTLIGIGTYSLGVLYDLHE